MTIATSYDTRRTAAELIASVPPAPAEFDLAELHQSLPFILTSALELLLEGDEIVACRILAATITRLTD
ncbi:hypothetical protein [Chromatium okenii]|uniref:hypothetical protein n=1 Tax=Chromatium okenii TaxID=61644 RepID=UPI0026EBD071|nr:hypothetical protein [Chromatium okenii]MBV5310811.1 hypothetical protein [Chromatium okenii]